MVTPQQGFRRHLQNKYGESIIKAFRGLENLYKKLARSQDGLPFLCKCRDRKIIPKGLILKDRHTGNSIQKILERANIALINDRINYHHKNKFRIRKDVGYVENFLYHRLTESDFNVIKTLGSYKREQTLSTKNHYPETSLKNTVVNLLNRQQQNIQFLQRAVISQFAPKIFQSLTE